MRWVNIKDSTKSCCVFVWMALGGNKATRNTSQILSFLIFAEIWNSKIIQTDAVMTVPGLILFLDLMKHKSTAASPCCKSTHWSPKWPLWRGLVGRRTHASSRIFSQLSWLCWRLRKTPSLCWLWVDQIRLIQFWHDKVIWWTQALAEREHSFKLGRNSSSA